MNNLDGVIPENKTSAALIVSTEHFFLHFFEPLSAVTAEL